jgi:hypothetical protein
MGRLRSRGFYGSVGCGLLHVVFCDQCFHQGSLFQPRHDIELMVLIDPSRRARRTAIDPVETMPRWC